MRWLCQTKDLFNVRPTRLSVGPALFCINTMPLEDIIFNHGLQYVMYADDIQLNITCSGDQVPAGTIEECLGEIRHWMGTNTLASSDRQTAVIHFSRKFYGQGPVPSYDLHAGRVSISPSKATCDLGVMMDSAGTMSNHVSRLCKSASFALWKISRTRTS